MHCALLLIVMFQTLSEPRFADAVTPGRLGSGAAREISGLVRSRLNPGLFWGHNDSGDIPRLFAFGERGESVAELRIADVAANDWEDMAVLKRAGKTLLLIGDIGDNRRSRDHVLIYGVEEPRITGEPVQQLQATPDFHLKARYPDGPRDAEALLADPISGDLYIVEKSNQPESGVYRLDLDNWREPLVLKRVATIRFGREPLTGNVKFTAGDVRDDGRVVLLRTYGRMFWWARDPRLELELAFETLPVRVPNPLEKQGEAVAFLAERKGYVTVSEGLHPQLWFFFQFP